MTRTSLAVTLILLSLTTRPQSLPPIYDHVPQQILRSKVFATYPRNTFLENLVTGNDGNLYVTNYPAGRVLRILPNGDKEEFARIPGKIAGIARYGENEFLVNGWDEKGKACIFRIDPKGQPDKFTDIEGGVFPNGITPLDDNRYLIADSYAGCIWLLDTRDKTIRVWLKDPLLERTSPQTQNPAANGLKIYKNALYVSNTDKQILIRIALTGSVPGPAEIYMKNVGIDDFSFDEDGDIFGATHVYNYVIKISPDKQVTIVAGPGEGVTGCTAVLCGKDNSGRPALYVTTNGGMSIPPPTGLEEGKIILLYLK